MKPKEFLDRLDDERVIAAIREAERHTSGEIRVYVSNASHSDANQAALKCFHRLKMDRTKLRNAVLIYLVPKTRQFALLGDEGIHRYLAKGRWEEIAREFCQALRDGPISSAVEATIARLSRELALHYPLEMTDRNELPDDILSDDDAS